MNKEEEAINGGRQKHEKKTRGIVIIIIKKIRKLQECEFTQLS